MRIIAISLLFLTSVLLTSSPGWNAADRIPFRAAQTEVRPVGTIVPQPSPFPDPPTPVVIRIVNRRATPIYLQGFRGSEERVQIYLYHRNGKEGWKPFFEFLPCDLPTCRGLHGPRKSCPKPVPFVVTLGPAGTPDATKEVPWEGALYQRSEATQEDRSHRYCYKGWVPKTGQMRVEIEFSDTLLKESEKNGMIGGRDHAVTEFDLPLSRPSYDIVIEAEPGVSPPPAH